MQRRNPPDTIALGPIDAWVFDLDNTLYPSRCNLFAQVDRRMAAFIARLLDITRTEARTIQKDYYYRYGTTLRGLMTCHGVVPADFLDFVHDIDVTAVPPDPALVDVVQTLPGRKYVFTNGSVAHAESVIARIGADGLFDAIFDIAAADYVPKPEARTYRSFVEATNIDPARTIMFEDLARNLEVPAELGMTTVLVRDKDGAADYVHDLDGPGTDAHHVHHVTADLTGFLRAAAPSG